MLCDVGQALAVERAIKAVIDTDGRIDDIVHNATSDLSPVPADLHQVSLADVESHVAVALGGLHSLARYGYQPLKASAGCLLLMTSEAGFEGKAKLPVYAGVKGAQRGFAKALAREWGAEGIRVNCLAPLAATPAMARALEHDPALSRQILGRNPLGRLGDTVADIGRAARFLLGDDARYITGHTLMVDGGSCPAI